MGGLTGGRGGCWPEGVRRGQFGWAVAGGKAAVDGWGAAVRAPRLGVGTAGQAPGRTWIDGRLPRPGLGRGTVGRAPTQEQGSTARAPGRSTGRARGREQGSTARARAEARIDTTGCRPKTSAGLGIYGAPMQARAGTKAQAPERRRGSTGRTPRPEPDGDRRASGCEQGPAARAPRPRLGSAA